MRIEAGSAARIAIVFLVLVVLAMRQVEEAVRVREVLRILAFLLGGAEGEVLEPGDRGGQTRLFGHAERLLGRDQLASLVIRHHAFGCALLRGLLHFTVKLRLPAQAERHRVDRGHALDVPMRPVADRGDRRLRRADEAGDLRIGEFRVELDQPQDRIRAVLALRERRVARAAALVLADGSGVELELQLVERVGLALVDFLLVELVVRDRVEALHAHRHVPVGDALHLELVHAAEIGDLLEAQRRVVHQPNGGCLGHQGLVRRHLIGPLHISLPGRETGCGAGLPGRGPFLVGNWSAI
ncbi:hypothetical protein SDC9_21350 [bioreactor metagenome]|uniref:Uncharacterized protein n=1 Tax=bioreactor metagenome TaxID=1076179 RepID=A0A644U9A2_9ZZZZ